MTETKWLTCTQPIAMLGHLRFDVDQRLARLFACACCRALPLTDPRSLQAVEVAARCADGRASPDELRATEERALAVYNDGTRPSRAAHLARTVVLTAAPFVHVASVVFDSVRGLPGAPRGKAGRAGRAERDRIQAHQAALLRCILGNPFRPSALSPDWLAWQGGTIPALARTIYDEQSFSQLPILADALEDAGCADESLLAHCRSPEPHARGCWVLDLLLGLR